MQSRLLAAAVAGALLIGAPAASALAPDDFKLTTTGSLYRVCSADITDPLYAEGRQACYGFLFGAGLFYYEAVKAEKIKKVVCPNENITRESVRVAFVDWAARNRDKMAESPIDGLVRSAAARWPCNP